MVMKIIVGAGKTKYNGWVSTQENELNLLNLEQWERLKENEEIEAILAEHVWEHLSLEDGIKAAENCYKFLKPGGYVRCAVPDKNFKNALYQSMIKVGGPGHESHQAAEHKMVYYYNNLVKVFDTLEGVINNLPSKKPLLILFSPSCVSYDQYSSYIERGSEFNKLIKRHCNL